MKTDGPWCRRVRSEWSLCIDDSGGRCVHHHELPLAQEGYSQHACQRQRGQGPSSQTVCQKYLNCCHFWSWKGWMWLDHQVRARGSTLLILLVTQVTLLEITWYLVHLVIIGHQFFQFPPLRTAMSPFSLAWAALGRRRSQPTRTECSSVMMSMPGPTRPMRRVRTPKTDLLNPRDLLSGTCDLRADSEWVKGVRWWVITFALLNI